MAKTKKSETSYEFLKNEIISGKMRPMQPISEETIQKKLNISRTPVREAILRLKEEGFIIVLPNKSTLVQPLSLDLLKHLYTMRRLNEPYICSMASLYISKDEIKSMYDKLTYQYQKIPMKEVAKLLEIDCQLHWKFLKACNNPFLLKAMSNVYDHIDRTRFLIMDPYTDEHAKEHMLILKAMIDGNKQQIEEASLNHIVKSEHRAMMLSLNY